MEYEIRKITFEVLLEQFDNYVVVQDGYGIINRKDLSKELPAVCIPKLSFISGVGDSRIFSYYQPEEIA